MDLKIISTSGLRSNLATVLAQAKGENAVLVKRRNDVEVALVDVDFLEDLLLLHDPEYRDSIAEARREAAEGRLFSHEEIFGG